MRLDARRKEEVEKAIDRLLAAIDRRADQSRPGATTTVAISQVNSVPASSTPASRLTV
jgi:hypothetical protein